MSKTRPQTLRDWAAGAFLEGDYATAVKVARRALESSPGDPVLYDTIGSSLVRLGQIDPGFQAHETAIQLAPDFAPLRHNYGTSLAVAFDILLKEGMQVDLLKRAQEQFLQTLELDMHHYLTYPNLVSLYMQLSQMVPAEKAAYDDKADSVVQKFFEVSPGVPMPLHIAGLFAEGKGYLIKDGFGFTVKKEEEQIVCGHDHLDVYGVAETFSQAFQELCEHFALLYKEYVETEEPLHSSGEKLANDLRDMVIEVKPAHTVDATA